MDDPGHCYVLPNLKSVELTTFFSKDIFATELLLRKSAFFIYEKGVEFIYSIKEKEADDIAFLYNRLGLEKKHILKDICFNTYGRLNTSQCFEPIIWEINDGTRKRLLNIIERVDININV